MDRLNLRDRMEHPEERLAGVGEVRHVLPAERRQREPGDPRDQPDRRDEAAQPSAKHPELNCSQAVAARQAPAVSVPPYLRSGDSVT